MSTYPLDKLLSLWKNHTLTVEQMVGHLLQHLIAQEKRIALLEKGQPRSASNDPVPPKKEVPGK